MISNTRAFGITLFAAMSVLAACTNQPNTVSVSDGAKQIYTAIQNNRKADPPPLDVRLAGETERALRASDPDQRLASISLPSIQAASVIRTISTNGDYTTWAAWGTSDRRSLTTKGGIITATRALGEDLMSADIDAVLDLVTRQEEGVAQYRQRYLDGDFQIIEAKSTCEITRGYDKEISVAGKSVPVMQMFSSCFSGEQQFVDLYMVNSTGKIVQSRQWIGPQIGFAVVTHLR